LEAKVTLLPSGASASLIRELRPKAICSPFGAIKVNPLAWQSKASANLLTISGLPFTVSILSRAEIIFSFRVKYQEISKKYPEALEHSDKGAKVLIHSPALYKMKALFSHYSVYPIRHQN
jgi:hypothetical protein